MSTTHEQPKRGVTRFRMELLVGMMLLVSVITAVVLYFTQRKVAADAEQVFRAAYEGELAGMHRLQELRHAALAERSKSLVRRPRIHAALEDNALDLLYPSAHDELRDLLEVADAPQANDDAPTSTLHATFYRFLDAYGAVITPTEGEDVGKLTAEEEARLTFAKPLESQQIGYLLRTAPDGTARVEELIAAPIISTETNEVIASIVLGFKPFYAAHHDGMRSGIWVNGNLAMDGITPEARAPLAEAITAAAATGKSQQVTLEQTPHLLFAKVLNPHSMFAVAHEVSLFPLTDSMNRQRQLKWQIMGVGALLLLGGLGASHFMSRRLSAPVEKMAVDSALNREGRQRAEAALELTSVELQRAARFSADASHQLKTPVTVLRAGLEELRQQPELSAHTREEISTLIHQTARLTGMIHDLLLLSRMDAGRLQLEMQDVDLTQIIDSLADDLSALPEGPDFDVEMDVPQDMHILGEKRYTAMILHNLMENAWKYNEPQGRISITAFEDGEFLYLRVGNTGPGIPPAAQATIFERFHRGDISEAIPGHGLGLNLARELARLHGGELRLLQSQDHWTEFEVCFRLSPHSAYHSPPL